MHTKSRGVSIFVLAMVVLLAINIGPVTKAQADRVAQELPPLSGYRIYFSEDHREASRFDRTGEGLSRLGGLLRGLGADLYTLEWRDRIPPEADLVIIAGPTWNLLTWRIARLWVYLNDGGSLLLMADLTGDPEATGLPAGSGVFDLLWIDTGLRGRDDIVVQGALESADGSGSNAASASPSQVAQGLSDFYQSATFTTSNVNTSHPITRGIEGDLAFFVARSLEISGTSAPFRVAPLIYSGPTYYGETSLPGSSEDEPFTFAYDEGVDTPSGALPLAAAVESMVTDTRIVVIGDREFATNERGLQTLSSDGVSYAYPNNVQFMLNAITWLLGADPVELQTTLPDSEVETSP